MVARRLYLSRIGIERKCRVAELSAELGLAEGTIETFLGVAKRCGILSYRSRAPHGSRRFKVDWRFLASCRKPASAKDSDFQPRLHRAWLYRQGHKAQSISRAQKELIDRIDWRTTEIATCQRWLNVKTLIGTIDENRIVTNDRLAADLGVSTPVIKRAVSDAKKIGVLTHCPNYAEARGRHVHRTVNWERIAELSGMAPLKPSPNGHAAKVKKSPPKGGREADKALEPFKRFVLGRTGAGDTAKPLALREAFLLANPGGKVPPKGTTRSFVSKARRGLVKLQRT